MTNAYDSRHYAAPEMQTARSLETLRTPRRFSAVIILLILLLAGVVLGLIYIPWQQSVTGAGQVFIAAPEDRPQNIEALIPARIVKWNVQEGQIVKSGDVVAEVEDIDSKFLDETQVSRLQMQRRAQESKLAAARNRAAALENQIASATRSRQVAVPSAGEKNLQNTDKFRAAEESVKAARQSLTTSELNKKRIQDLHDQGLRSRRDLELAELEVVRTRTELERTGASLEVARRDLAIGNFDQQKVDADTAASLSALSASLAAAGETIATIESDILKLDVELANTAERREQNIIRAPTSGQIVRLLKVGSGATVKAGDVLAVIAPLTEKKTVELFLNDNDAPLVAVGRQVRLQFAGFPAVQFSGAPDLAYGTFAGRVAVIDPVDDGKNRYRILVVPDEEAIASGRDEPWPSNTVLRPGSEAVGWIMLDTVSLGFELWRQFNAFPPTVEQGPAGTRSDEKKLDEKIDLKDVLKK